MKGEDRAALASLRSRLDGRNIPYERLDDGLIVAAKSATGFDATIQVDDDGCHLQLDAWHEEFENRDEGFTCFVMSLSNACRLAITRRGFDHKWTLQSRRDESWRDVATTGLLLFPYFLRGQTRYLQNNWWDGDTSVVSDD